LLLDAARIFEIDVMVVSDGFCWQRDDGGFRCWKRGWLRRSSAVYEKITLLPKKRDEKRKREEKRRGEKEKKEKR